MKIGIVGGTGLIGRNLTFRLLEIGYSVRILSRFSNIPELLQGKKNLEVIGESFPRPESLKHLDAIINLAGSPIAGVRWTKKVKEEIRSSRVDYTESLVSSISKVADTLPKVLIQGSAIGYYGSYDDNTENFSEHSSYGKDFLASLCVDWETAAEPISKLGIRLVQVRTGVVLSPQGGALKSMLPSFRLGLGGPLGSGNQILSWIHIEDAVNAIIHLLENPNFSGPFNLVAPNSVNNKVFSKTLAGILKRPAVFKVPATVLKILFEEGADVILKGQKVAPEKLQKSGFSFLYPELETALQNLLRSES
ncbi:TIGR01777 family protein [Leptospira kirschneri str. 200803703]|uniref:TIGR01777 family oxidoreductase n=1 Tax=Leptospira kirschneri TaxID=29507 RepID=UPI000288028A|nr:TIGR01777 family oxidoreductase [Leptospira kirschneri]EMK17201.1 TIGR01777 family protein [Leptospira kirschneri serovar Bim str. PUO 1247]EMN05438.1 TIGR01777 family protein [Leptospira kirschneri serovar Bim str. 1051]EMN25012.1 TIGR01777 family protein [Leptospira kirschneri serovar Sokoine str. RM1]EMO65449.1 TIGR01777 family protein [Leptospira kirschneri str. 200803703]EMO82026.1 TIGR01777 family protein [Leptospira kirschneri str. 200801774]